MQYRAEHRQVDLLGDLLDRLQSRHMTEIESQRTFDILIKGRRRQGAPSPVEILLQNTRGTSGFRGRDGFRLRQIHAEPDRAPQRPVRRFVLQLIDIAAGLARTLVVAARAVGQVDGLRPL